MKSENLTKISFFYFITIFALFLYSFTQIDLSLTFSRISVLQNLVKSFQYVGYFNRPLSTYIYIGILMLLFGFYLYFLKLAEMKKITSRTVWKIIIATSVLLLFSYNAFSYDLFNYIFDAKIYSHYHLNPYLHKALDFPGDPMLSFMRWTHRVYPYGPVWLFLTIPLSYVGMNLFLPTFFMYKFLLAASFLGTLYFISKILKKVMPQKEVFGLVFFGLNPLIIIENLVSGHLDIVMVFFALFAFYQLINKKYFTAIILLMLSIGVKFATAFLIPVFILVIYLKIRNRKINWKFVLSISLILMILTVLVASNYSGNFQPWYLILPLAYAVFFLEKDYVLIPGIVLSLFALFDYAPYLYLGNWDPPVPQILSSINTAGVALSFICVLVYSLFLKTKNSKR